jgi:hypothetical protein
MMNAERIYFYDETEISLRYECIYLQALTTQRNGDSG